MFVINSIKYDFRRCMDVSTCAKIIVLPTIFTVSIVLFLFTSYIFCYRQPNIHELETLTIDKVSNLLFFSCRLSDIPIEGRTVQSIFPHNTLRCISILV